MCCCSSRERAWRDRLVANCVAVTRSSSVPWHRCCHGQAQGWVEKRGGVYLLSPAFHDLCLRQHQRPKRPSYLDTLELQRLLPYGPRVSHSALAELVHPTPCWPPRSEPAPVPPLDDCPAWCTVSWARPFLRRACVGLVRAWSVERSPRACLGPQRTAAASCCTCRAIPRPSSPASCCVPSAACCSQSERYADPGSWTPALSGSCSPLSGS